MQPWDCDADLIGATVLCVCVCVCANVLQFLLVRQNYVEVVLKFQWYLIPREK